MTPLRAVHCLLWFLLITSAFPVVPVRAEVLTPSVRVVMEDNYPPFVFKDRTGNPQGSQIDLWRLWEQKTGRKAHITLMDWAEAQRRLQNGEFDVIDKIAKTGQRLKIYDFSEPFATIDVPAFFLKDISGITDAPSLKGFAVGVQAGDSAIEHLNNHGVDNLLLFNNYEEIVLAAKEHKVNVMVMDKPPALYFLHKHGILNDFKQSSPLRVIQLHRAVKKGNRELLAAVEDGFRLITPDEVKKIETKWYGSSLGNSVPTTSILVGIGVLCLLVLILFAWNRTLKTSVEKRTAELKNAKETLRKSEEKFRQHIECSTDVIFTLNVDGFFMFASPAWERHFGYPVSDILNKHFAHFIHPEDHPPCAEYLQRIFASGQPETSPPYRVKCADGSWRPFEANGSTFVDAAGEVLFIGVGHDITERKKNEEDRLNLERQLLHAQKLESLGVLSGGIAHDFNNLLLAILGNLDLALKRLPQELPARRNIEQAVNAAQHAAQLTNMMLAYSGKGLFVIKPLNLTELAEENATMLDAAIPKSIALQRRLDHSLPIINADAGQLQQVIMNLITNAAEAIGEGNGTVTLTTGFGEFDRKTLNESRLDEKNAPGTYVWLEVHDNGCGMDEDTLRKLFDPFFTTKFTGRGLGMSAVLGIIRAHKGAFLINSAPGAGTTIKVLFPVAEHQPFRPDPANEAWPAPEEQVGRAVRVLVVDDEEMIRTISVAMLEELGFETLAAASGEEALAIFRREGDSIGIVLLDQVMPGMDGVSVFKELRSIRSDVRVLLASGFSLQEVSERFRGLGLNGFIPKPYTLKNLGAEVSRVVQGADA